MKVLYFIDGIGGGAITHTLALARGLAAYGVESVILFFVDGPSVDLAREYGLDVRFMEWRFSLDPTLMLGLVRIIGAEKVDIVHAHTIMGNFYSRIAARLSSSKPLVFSTTHSFVIDELKGETRVTLKDYLRYKRELYLSGFTDQFIAVSDGIRDRLHDVGIPKNKVQVITNGVAIPSALTCSSSNPQLREELGIAKDDVVVANIGRLVFLKNHKMFIKAARKVVEVIPKARFLIIGDGELRESLEEFSEGLGRNIIFVGWQNDVDRFYQIIDILVQCSFTESQGLTVLEAMGFGKPVIATDINDMGKTVMHGKTGLLVPSDDEEALSKAVINLIENKTLAAEVGQSGREFVETKFSLETMVKKTVQIYKEVLLRRHSSCT